MSENKCLWCKSLLPAGAIFCKKEDYPNNLPDGCGAAYVKMLKFQKNKQDRELTEYEQGILDIIKEFGLALVSATPLEEELIDAGSVIIEE